MTNATVTYPEVLFHRKKKVNHFFIFLIVSVLHNCMLIYTWHTSQIEVKLPSLAGLVNRAVPISVSIVLGLSASTMVATIEG